MANDAAMTVACGTRWRGFDPGLDLDDAALAAAARRPSSSPVPTTPSAARPCAETWPGA
jgi:hypothetical protein